MRINKEENERARRELKEAKEAVNVHHSGMNEAQTWYTETDTKKLMAIKMLQNTTDKQTTTNTTTKQY